MWLGAHNLTTELGGKNLFEYASHSVERANHYLHHDINHFSNMSFVAVYVHNHSVMCEVPTDAESQASIICRFIDATSDLFRACFAFIKAVA
jgi:hypothetical protein